MNYHLGSRKVVGRPVTSLTGRWGTVLSREALPFFPKKQGDPGQGKAGLVMGRWHGHSKKGAVEGF